MKKIIVLALVFSFSLSYAQTKNASPNSDLKRISIPITKIFTSLDLTPLTSRAQTSYGKCRFTYEVEITEKSDKASIEVFSKKDPKDLIIFKIENEQLFLIAGKNEDVSADVLILVNSKGKVVPIEQSGCVEFSMNTGGK